MRLLTAVFLLISLFFYSQSFSQRYPKDTYNSLGIQAGINYGGLVSEDLPFTSLTGFSVGFSTRANIYNNFIFLYGIKYFQHNSQLEVLIDGSSPSTEMAFETTGIQINFFAGHKIIGDYLSIEAGPVLQINSNLSVEEGLENTEIPNYNLVAADLENISKLNFALAGQISAGLSRFKVFAQYQYGLSNMFRSLDTRELREKEARVTDLNGRLGLATAGVVVYF